jgi:hypothetical protein
MRVPPLVRLLLPVVAVMAASCALIPLGTFGTVRGDSGVGPPAELWLSWSPETRAQYVFGYLSGFQEGNHRGCEFYANEMVVYMPDKVVPFQKLKRQDCHRAMPPGFTRPYFQVYVDAITDYYSKYPQDRHAEIPQVLLELAFSRDLNIDRIHTKRNGGDGANEN